jgi:solute carrier family 25 folate transporter 32
MVARSDAQSSSNSNTTRHALASQFAGGASTLLFYPLDVVKMRFMAQDGTEGRKHNRLHYGSMRQALSTIYREEGLNALFRGAHVAVFAAAVSWGAYMYVYRSFDILLRGTFVDEKSADGGVMPRFDRSVVAGICSGLLVNFATNPLWLVKARIQLVREGEERFGFVKTLTGAVQRDGVLSLWRGTSAQLLTGVPNSLQFPIYEASKRLYRSMAISADPAPLASADGVAEVTFSTCITKAFVGLTSHPLQLLKARLMDGRSREGPVRYERLLASTAMIVQREGWAGLYRGIVVGLAHTVPRAWVQFLMFESYLSFTGHRS